jgi:hypothetical protein
MIPDVGGSAPASKAAPPRQSDSFSRVRKASPVAAYHAALLGGASPTQARQAAMGMPLEEEEEAPAAPSPIISNAGGEPNLTGR